MGTDRGSEGELKGRGVYVSRLAAIGLLLHIPLAAFVAWFIFFGPRVAEFPRFIFPFIAPVLVPASLVVLSPITYQNYAGTCR